MSEANTRDLYPHSTLQGEPLPFDVLLGVGLIVVAFTNVVSADIAIPSDAEILELSADQDCYVRLGETNVVAPVDGTHYDDTFFVPANSAKCIDVNGFSELTVIRRITSGTLHIQTARRYKDAHRAQQFSRP